MSDPVENIFKSRRFKLFGVVDTQQIIKYIFGGHASLAIIMLILICLFLLKEAWLFLPEHHHNLEIYRETGKEYVDYVKKEKDAHTNVYSALNRAYYTDVLNDVAKEDDQLKVFLGLKLYMYQVADEEVRRLEAAMERREDAEDGTPEAAKLDEEIAGHREALLERSKKIMRRTKRSDLDFKTNLSRSDFAKLKEEVLVMQPGQETEPEFIKEIRATANEKRAAALKEYVALKDFAAEYNKAGEELKNLERELVDIAMENGRIAIAYKTAPMRKNTKLKDAELTNDPEEAKKLREEAAAIDITAPDYEALTAPLYASKDEHARIAANLRESAQKLMDEAPKKANSKLGTKYLREAKRENAKLVSALKTNAKKVERWNHEKPYSFLRSVGQFFWGREWVTNSSWHDFYGVMPLFTGSLLISIIATVVAVPFSLGAAIYVNQLASKNEQDIVKPSIEFIEAIPSVVLGFFGIAVLGTVLREFSQADWVAWIPGFPMSERLTILNAGLLLAFMAMPTIFTLCEDALNNVPDAYTQASLSVGASKMQTILGILLPSAISGIIAAILLGFGRIIGETMVVLLVAGNKIAMPDWSLGFGVITQPPHTMTGIIAQELGEVDEGSEHWAALFMIGMILFMISLIINFSAQQIIKRFHQG